MRNRPCLLFMCMFLLGILLARTKIKWIIVFAMLLFLFAAPHKEQGFRRVLFATVLPLLFLLGNIRTVREDTFRNNYLKELKDGSEITLAGKLNRIEQKSKCLYYYLTDCTISLSDRHMPCNDVIAYVSADDYSIGQILVLHGTVSLFEEAANEGNFDARNFYQSQKIDFGVWVERVESVHGKKSAYRQMLLTLQSRLQEVLKPSDPDGVLSAMLLGEKSGLDADTKSLYQRAGIAHILAISGLHVSLLGMGLYQMLRRRGISYKLAAVVTAVLMLSYAVMTGNSISTRRAIGMLLIYLLADLLGYGYDLLSALGAVVIFLLWENPFLIGYSGFLFSAAAVLGVGIGGSIINEYRALFHENKKENKIENEKEGRLSGFVQKQKEGICVSLGIQLFTLPLVAYNYFEIPIYAMLLNIFVLALVNYLLLFAVWGAGTGTVLPKIGSFLLVFCGWILKFYKTLCQFFLSLPGAVYICGKPALWKMVTYYILLSVLLFFFWKKTSCGSEKTDTKRWKYPLSFIAFIPLFIILFFPEKREQEIDVLNVGQGDGIYLCTSDGGSLFIDGGSSDIGKVGTYRILPFLKSRGIKNISYWFVSHTDSDHISGLEEALKEGWRIEHLVFAKASENEEKTMELCRLAKKNETEVLFVSAGNVLHIKQADIRCLYPAENEMAEINDRCLVLLYEDSGISAFFGGDISTEIEEKIAASDRLFRVDFYKAGHHGSRYSNGDMFLEILSPQITVASAGENNRYGHPAADAVERIKNSGSRFYCTAVDGQVKVKKRGDGLTRVK